MAKYSNQKIAEEANAKGLSDNPDIYNFLNKNKGGSNMNSGLRNLISNKSDYSKVRSILDSAKPVGSLLTAGTKTKLGQ